MNFNDSRVSGCASVALDAMAGVSTPTEVTRNEIDCVVGMLEHRAEDLLGILDPVLRPQMEKKGGPQASNPAATKQHARLGVLHERLSLINERLGDLIQRIEV